MLAFWEKIISFGKIKYRIAIGFVSVLILLVFVWQNGTIAIKNLSFNISKQSVANQNSLNVAQIDRRVFEIKNYLLSFVYTANEAALETVKTLNLGLEDYLKEVEKNIDDQGYSAQLIKMQELVSSYGSDVNVLEQKIRKKDGLVFQSVKPYFSSTLSYLNGKKEYPYVQDAVEAILKLELNFNSYLSTSSRRALMVVNRSAKTYKDTIANLEKESFLDGKLFEKFSQYEKHFVEISSLVGEIYELTTNVMAPKADEISAIASDINKAIHEDSENLKEAITKNAETTITNSNIVSLFALIFGIFMALVISKSIVAPVAYISNVMDILGTGNTSIEIKGMDRKDEFGGMAKSVEIFRQNAIKNEELEEERKQAEIKTAEERRKVMIKLADDFEKAVLVIVDTVSSAAVQLNSSAQTMSAISEETSRQASSVAAASEQAAINVQTVSAASEELSNSIADISRQVNDAATIASQAVEEIEATNNVVVGLAESAKKISEVVNLITDIANQTNLLALNATIEAARAGDAGKGFAVVAGEVKNLANQTAKATEEISSQIEDVQIKTSQAVDAITKIGNVVNNINEISSSVAHAVEEQGAATQEISRNIEQAVLGTKEVSSNITSVTSAAGEAGEASNQVLSASKQLSQDATNLREQVVSFIENIRKG